ncbi:MAG: substrate-binding domain-containing protein [Anaerolineae bacterium]|nr:substrate-binding domain-containing protein [Anaerolineae bacterium]
MKHIRRLVGLAVVAIVLLTALAPNAASPSRAQNTNAVTIDGSNIVSPILKTAIQRYQETNKDAQIELNVSGTGGGFEKLCNNALDINMAVRPITDSEAAACQNKNVQFIELLIGYDALVVVVNSASTLTCLTIDQTTNSLNKLLSPSAAGVKNWNAVDAALGDVAINNVYFPAAESQAYVLADSLVAGDKLRNDAQTTENPAQVAQKVGSEAGSVGIMTLSDYRSAAATSQTPTIRALQLKGGSTCVDADVPSLEEARYPAAESLYLYVNAASLDRKPVADFLNYLVGRDGRSAVTNAGFVVGSNTTYDRAQNYLTRRQTGRTFSRIQSVNIPADTTGTYTIDGAGWPVVNLKAVIDAFSPRYTKVTVTPFASGDEAGYRKLCANNADLIGTTRLPTDAEAAACQKANVQMLRVPLGTQGVVVLVNGKNEFAQCLTTDQLAKIFSADSGGKVKKWSDVDPKFPAIDLLVLTPTDGVPETDLLMSKIVKGVAPVRRTDVTDNADPLYRAAATQNVDGAITYLTFAEFQTVKSNVKAVQVNAGSNCVDPSEANLKNGTYPLAQQQFAVLNVGTFTRPEVKAFVWFLLSDDALAVLSKQGLVGTDTTAISAARDTVLGYFAQSGAPGAATPAATGVATLSATAAATAPAASTLNATPAATAAQ